jgi:hypothetical protein
VLLAHVLPSPKWIFSRAAARRRTTRPRTPRLGLKSAQGLSAHLVEPRLAVRGDAAALDQLRVALPRRGEDRLGARRCTTAARSSGRRTASAASRSSAGRFAPRTARARPPRPRLREPGPRGRPSPGRSREGPPAAGELDRIAGGRAGREKVPPREPCAPLLDGDRPHAHAPAASNASFTSRSASSLCSRRTAV